MSELQPSSDELTLKFVLDGILYSLSVQEDEQTREQLLARAKLYLPDLHLLDENLAELD